MAKDRARPFSKKHRKYWITVTGGMILISAINVGIGMCAYDKGPDRVERIEPVIPVSTAPVQTRVTPPAGMIGLGEIPVLVMRAFTKEHPQHVPTGARKRDDDTFELYYREANTSKMATYRADGTSTATGSGSNATPP